MYTLYNSSVELDTRLATAPQPAFHYNTLLASLAINSSLPLSPFSITLPLQASKQQASSSLLLAFASMVILGVEPHRDP
jgi:hypothetical protein